MKSPRETPAADTARASGDLSNGTDGPANSPIAPLQPRTVSSFYLAIMAEMERRRLSLGFAMEPFSEFAGLADRSFAKYMAPWSVSGRHANWSTLEIIADALYPDGFDLRIIARKGPKLDALRLKFSLAFDRCLANPVSRRDLLAEWGARGGRSHSREHMAKIGRRGAQSRCRKLSKEQRTELARRAGIARQRGGKK